MYLTDKQYKELLEVSKPLIKWLNENVNPHYIAIVENDAVQLLCGIATQTTDEFIR